MLSPTLRMKSFLKLTLLFSLIVAGRYMQSVAPTPAGLQRKPPLAVLTPDTVLLTHYTSYSTSLLTPVVQASQHKRPTATWY